ncbi:7502_t:CDS:2, partial [Funneliformis caledonium]
TPLSHTRVSIDKTQNDSGIPKTSNSLDIIMQDEIGPFHKSFSAVVKSNGSGKSNVIDVLLFVFSYRANKMRQAKLSELIHSSQGRENLDACSVDIYFEEILDLLKKQNNDILISEKKTS